MGLLCGVCRIDIAHELGHRATRWERDLARFLLLSSLYMHFIIEHNRGHHRRVATPMIRPRRGMARTSTASSGGAPSFSASSAHGASRRTGCGRGHQVFGPHNEMIRFLLLEAGLVAAMIAFVRAAIPATIIAALIGILLLETVNYIEHYGLGRRLNERGTTAVCNTMHSWNSDHLIGRLMLFELTRHSDRPLHGQPEIPGPAQRRTTVRNCPPVTRGTMILSLFPALVPHGGFIIARLAEQEPALTFAARTPHHHLTTALPDVRYRLR